MRSRWKCSNEATNWISSAISAAETQNFFRLRNQPMVENSRLAICRCTAARKATVARHQLSRCKVRGRLITIKKFETVALLQYRLRNVRFGPMADILRHRAFQGTGSGWPFFPSRRAVSKPDARTRKRSVTINRSGIKKIPNTDAAIMPPNTGVPTA
jgi:hypothetical protein